MNPVGNYMGIQIYEDFGYFHSAIDPSVESRNIYEIVAFIRSVFFKAFNPNITIDSYIIAELVLTSPFQHN